MRVKRVRKYKMERINTIKKLLFYGILLPLSTLFIGYLITIIAILPNMTK